MNKSYSAHITDAKVMIDALRNNHGKVTKIDNPFIMEMERLREEVERLNSEQERLKADLKSKTEELTNRIKELEKNGMQVAFPDTKPFIQAAAPVYEELKAQVGEADYKYFMDLLEKSRK